MEFVVFWIFLNITNFYNYGTVHVLLVRKGKVIHNY